MRTVAAVGVALTLGVVAVFLWILGYGLGPAVSSSQIFIHGTPVCITQRGGEIRATVGACSALRHVEPRGEGSYRHHGGVPSPGDPRLKLPPGHPPIGPDDGPIGEPNRRVLI